MADVLGGHVAMTFVPIAAAVPHVKAGKLRALGITGATHSAILPEVPTISESGVPGYEATSWNALLAPGALPRDIVLKVHGALVQSLRAPKVSGILVSSGADAVGNMPDELARFLRDEMVKWGNVVKAAGVKPE